MDKKLYTSASIEVIKLDCEDVITTSAEAADLFGVFTKDSWNEYGGF